MAKSRDDEDGPERTCIVTRRKGDPASMIRFVLGPESCVVPDVRRKLPGRGVWVGAQSSLVAEAVKKQAFARGFKTKVATSPALAVETEDLLVRDCLQALAMANKAGLLVTGFAKVESTIAAGGLGAVVHASDAGEDGVRKIEGALRRHGVGRKQPDVVTLFSSEQLDLALGRTNVIHAALAEGPAGEAFLTRCRRLTLYRSEAPFDGDAAAEAQPA